jgi:hypothetical protein
MKSDESDGQWSNANCSIRRGREPDSNLKVDSAVQLQKAFSRTISTDAGMQID